MNILVCGLGSMGRRRIKLIQQHYKTDICIFGVDSNATRANLVAQEFNITVYKSISECTRNNTVQCAFVCASPLAHYAIITECLSNNLHVFTEINVVSDGYQEMIEMASSKNLRLFLSSTMIYRKDIQYIIDKAHTAVKPTKYIYHVGQYLPDWHPWENINDFFVTNIRTNGLREIMAVDLPWVVKAFGRIVDYKVMKSNLSTLKVNFPDTIEMLLTHESGAVGMISFDIVARRSGSFLRVINEDFDINWQGTPDSIEEYNITEKTIINIKCDYSQLERDSRYAPNIIENAYLDEIIAFFDYIADGKNPRYSFEEDLVLLNIIDAMEG